MLGPARRHYEFGARVHRLCSFELHALRFTSTQLVVRRATPTFKQRHSRLNICFCSVLVSFPRELRGDPQHTSAGVFHHSKNSQGADPRNEHQAFLKGAFSIWFLWGNQLKTLTELFLCCPSWRFLPGLAFVPVCVCLFLCRRPGLCLPGVCPVCGLVFRCLSLVAFGVRVSLWAPSLHQKQRVGGTTGCVRRDGSDGWRSPVPRGRQILGVETVYLLRQPSLSSPADRFSTSCWIFLPVHRDGCFSVLGLRFALPQGVAASLWPAVAAAANSSKDVAASWPPTVAEAAHSV